MVRLKFVKNFKLCAIISLILMAPGIAGVVLLPFGIDLFNFDIDFLGGTVMQYELHQVMDKPRLDEIGDLIEDIIGISPTVQRSGDTGVVIKTLDIDTDLRQSIDTMIKDKFAGAIQLEAENVTATVGADLRNAAIMSVVIASLLILLYITIRFEFKSGLAAVFSQLHDVFIMLSCYVVLQIPMGMTFIAAMLTTLGYSLNASVVVFDRMRENRKYMPKADFRDIADTSAGQTFMRNINTTVSTILPLVMIIILGVASVRNFAIPMAVGVAAGAYSSVFLAAPMWSFLRGNGGKKEKA